MPIKPAVPEPMQSNGHRAQPEVAERVRTTVTGGTRGAAGGTDARRRARTVAKQQQGAERIASAAAELSRGVAESSEASSQLSKAMHEIAKGAEESSTASAESLAVGEVVEERIGRQKAAAARVQSTVTTLQGLLDATTVGMQELLVNVGQAADRQDASVKVITELEKQAEEIGDIVKTVARIADQTNLLALNAAIEAARARQHGKGFAVVADEVRTLAETSEKSASEIRTLIDEIRTSVNRVAEGVGKSAETARGEVEKGKAITEQLRQVREVMVTLLSGATDIATAAEQAVTASLQARRGSEEIAAAAEEQSAACEESLQAVAQQSTALAQSNTAADELSEVAEELHSSTDIAKSAEAAASSAEELSAAIEEINRSASQITTAVEQIQTGARQASVKGQEAATGFQQIGEAATLSEERAKESVRLTGEVRGLLAENKSEVDVMIEAIASSAKATRESTQEVAELEQISRRIDKIVDAIGTVSIQTNMLAVNGSVESARAGEFGKGFAVVSTDIRNLARDSAENADQIKELVKTIQDRVVQVRGDLDETSRLAFAEVERATETTTRLEQIERDMVVVNDAGQEVLEAAEEIARATGEAQRGLEQIAAAAEQAEMLTQQAAGATEEQRQGTEQLATAVEEIAALADELQSA
jgi:methyl-accepting chemotaxis protein